MRQTTRIKTALALVVALAAGFVLSASLDINKEARADRLWSERRDNPAALNQDDPINLGSFARLAKTLGPTVVNINVERSAVAGKSSGRFRNYLKRHYGRVPPEYMNRGLGSGFIIHADGWVLTNNHVVDGASRIQIKLHNDHVYDAKVVGADEKTDVALVKFEPKEEIIAAPLGNSTSLEIAEWVIAIGNPFGLNHTVTAGIVSAKGRQDVNPDGKQLYSNFIQTDASINPGNSGGPLINIRGEVIGINTAINASGQGIGFAIPIDMVKVLLPQLRTGRIERSWLGVMIQGVNPELAKSLGMRQPNGALVAEVVPKGPADHAGLQAGDVITHFDGRRVNTAKDLPWLASTAGIGKDIKVTVWRDRKGVQKVVRMGQLPGNPTVALPEKKEPPKEKAAADFVEPDGSGMRVEALTAAQQSEFKLDTTPLGALVVTRVQPGSPAAEADIRVGDVILKVSNRSMKALENLEQAVEGVSSGRAVMLLVKRADRKLFRSFTRK